MTDFLIILGSVAVYFTPTLVAFLRDHRYVWPIVVTNLFLGWTYVGWVAALAWSVAPKSD
jgi:hypothetical protein